LIDLGWRGLGVDGEIVIDGVEINIPINILRDQEPEAYTFIVGTEAEEVLNRPLIEANFILEQPMTNRQGKFRTDGLVYQMKNGIKN